VRWNNFLAQSGWTTVNPNSSAFTRAGDWWYRTDAAFASEYAKGSPNEDFAESFAAYFTQRAGWPFYNNDRPDVVDGADAIPDKIQIIAQWVASL
jgi:hypothetical protein